MDYFRGGRALSDAPELPRRPTLCLAAIMQMRVAAVAPAGPGQRSVAEPCGGERLVALVRKALGGNRDRG